MNYHKNAKPNETVCDNFTYAEAATRGVLCKKVFSEILQSSQEKSCARVSLITLQASGLWILRNFKENLFYRTLLAVSTCGNKNSKLRSLTSPSEIDFNGRINSVESKDVSSNKSNCKNFNITTSNRFDKTLILDNMKIDHIIEIDVANTKQIPVVKCLKKVVKKKPEIVGNQNPEKQHIFGKRTIQVTHRQKTNTDEVHPKIKKHTRKVTSFTDSIPRGISMR